MFSNNADDKLVELSELSRNSYNRRPALNLHGLSFLTKPHSNCFRGARLSAELQCNACVICHAGSSVQFMLNRVHARLSQASIEEK